MSNHEKGKGKSKRGRPSGYKPEFAEQARRLCSIKAFTDMELAQFFGCAVASIYNWKKEHPEFVDAIKSGKNDPDARVEAGLFERAIGYKCPETKVFLHEGKPVMVDMEKHYAPDPVAAIFWLVNRRPDRWKRNVDDSAGDDAVKKARQAKSLMQEMGDSVPAPDA
jgi:hypothetical protein